MVILTKKKYQQDKVIMYAATGASAAMATTGIVLSACALRSSKNAVNIAEKTATETDIRVSSVEQNLKSYTKSVRVMQDVLRDSGLVRYGNG